MIISNYNDFGNEFIESISENWYSDGLHVEDLVCENSSIEFSLKLNGEEMLETFKIASYGYITSPKDQKHDYILPFTEYNHFGFSWLRINPHYKNKGICSYVMLRIIFVVISKYPNRNFLFDLKNTSKEIEDPLRLYSSILTNSKDDFQYRYFEIKDRESDIEKIAKKFIDKESKVTMLLSEDL